MMKAAIWRGIGKLVVEDFPLPELIDGSVILKVKSCAVCGSDLRIFQSGNDRIRPPRILGHEVAGEIVEVGKGVRKFQLHDRVSLGADVPCGACHHCLNGRANCCDTNLAIGYQFDGGFAEYMRLDPIVVKFGPVQTFDKQLSYDLAALAEPLACCINGFDRAYVKKGGSIVIFGAGPIGIILALLAKFYDSSLIIIEPSDYRREIAKQMFPDACVINPNFEDPVKAIMHETKGQGANAIFTACSVVKTHEQAVLSVSKRGFVNFFGGLPKSAKEINLLSNHIHYREAYITGSHGSTPLQHKRALKMIAKKDIALNKLISSKISLSNINQVFSNDHIKNNLKSIIKPELSSI